MALYAFDGTWNREHDQAHYSENSNVVKFAKAYADAKAVYQKDGDKPHIVEDDDSGYISGVGTRHGEVGKILGGLVGLGGRTRIREAIARVERKFREGDQVIDVVGFSRGAALALHFVNEVAEREHFSGVRPRVRFLGLWDVVAAFGIPKDIGFLKFQKINVGWHLTLPAIVNHCFHAMALDERRESFRVTRVNGAYEVWFRGVHSDVGGGNENEKLNNIALTWMLRKAAAVGVNIQPGSDALEVDATVPVSKNRDPRLDPFREFQAADWMHHTITIRKDPEVCQDPPPTCPRETPELERTRVRLS